MQFTARQIADYLHGTVEGNENIVLTEMAKIEEGREGSLTFLANPKYTRFIYTTCASACLVRRDFTPEKPLNITLIRVDDPYESLAKLLALAKDAAKPEATVHPTAIVHPSARLGEGVYIGAYAVIEEGVTIGNNVRIYPHCFVDRNCTIGNDSLLYARVTLYHAVVLGNRCTIHSGAVIGADGFGFAPNKEGAYDKIEQIGTVVIADDVEVGANTTIDRSTMGATVVNKGVKIDNLVQIAHNVEIGEHTVIAAQTGIAGSSKVGVHCMLGGQVGVANHLTVADYSSVAAQTGIITNIKEPGKAWQGFPAMPLNVSQRLSIVKRQSLDYLRRFNEMEKKINELTNK